MLLFTNLIPNTHTHSLCSAVNGVEDGLISGFGETYDAWLRPGFGFGFGFGFAGIGGLGSLHCDNNVILGGGSR